MSGENNLDRLLQNMHPQAQDGSFVFLTSANGFSEQEQRDAVMLFKEVEGITIIIKEELAKALTTQTPRWAMITLTVRSDLNAVGFLAVITRKLADAGISVNPVSAFYHDHLFVPWDKREEAMEILHSFSKKIS